MTSNRRLAVGFLAVAVAGCGGHGLTLAPVSGTVTLAGKPLANARVTFLPDPARGADGPAAEGVTDAAGRYTLRCVDPARRIDQDGAVVGWHFVTVDDADPPAIPQGQEPPPRKVPAKYGNLTFSGLSAEVKPGGGPIDFALTR